jgi:hypothetical protein
MSTYDWETGNIAHIRVAIKLCLGKHVDRQKKMFERTTKINMKVSEVRRVQFPDMGKFIDGITD